MKWAETRSENYQSTTHGRNDADAEVPPLGYRAYDALELSSCEARIMLGVQKLSWSGCSLPVRGQPLDRRHLGAVRLDGQAGARFHCDTVQQHGAGATLARVAPDLRAVTPPRSRMK